MRRTGRIGMIALGAAMAVYGAASLTGGWLGTPPWWERRQDVDVWISLREADGLRLATVPEKATLRFVEELEGRERVSAVVTGAGAALASLAAWRPRRDPGPPPPAGQDAASAAT